MGSKGKLKRDPLAIRKKKNEQTKGKGIFTVIGRDGKKLSNRRGNTKNIQSQLHSL